MSEGPPPREDVPIFNPVNFYGTSALNAIGANKVDFPVAQGQETFPFGIRYAPDNTGDGSVQTSAYTGAGSFGSSGGTTYQNATITLDDAGEITNIASGSTVTQYDLEVQENGVTVNTNPLRMNFIQSTNGVPTVTQDGGDPTQVNVAIPPCPNVSDNSTTINNPVQLLFSSDNVTVTSPSPGQAAVSIAGITVQDNGVNVTTDTDIINFVGDDVSVAADASGNAVVTVTPHTTAGYIKGLGTLYQYSIGFSYTVNAGGVNTLWGVTQPSGTYSSGFENVWPFCPHPFSLFFNAAPPAGTIGGGVGYIGNNQWTHSGNNNNLVIMQVEYSQNVSTVDNNGLGNVTDRATYYTKGLWYVNPWLPLNVAGYFPSTILVNDTQRTASRPPENTTTTSYSYTSIAAFKDGQSGNATGWSTNVPTNTSINGPTPNGFNGCDEMFYYQPYYTQSSGSEGRYAVNTAAQWYFDGTVSPTITNPGYTFGASGAPAAQLSLIPFGAAGLQQPANASSSTRTTSVSCNVTFLQVPYETTIMPGFYGPNNGSAFPTANSPIGTLNTMEGKILQIST